MQRSSRFASALIFPSNKMARPFRFLYTQHHIGSDIRLHTFSEKLRVLLALGKTFRDNVKSVQPAEAFGTYQKVALVIDRIEKNR